MNRPLHKFESVESFVFLDQRGGTGSSASASPKYAHQCDVGSVHGATLTVSVSIRRGRVLLVTTLVLGLILGLTYTFRVGVELKRFQNNAMNATALERLLDDYNAYSGNIASAFGKPVEVFVAVLVQIITLRFMAHAYVRPTTSWQLTVCTLFFSAGAGYLINNSFNALNVQLRAQEIRSVILASDLSTASSLSGSIATRTTNVTHTVSEMEPKNLISNTVLRNAVLPRVPFKQDICAWDQTQHESGIRGGEIPLPTVDYGFTQRDWQSRLLQEALDAQTLRIVVNATSKTANADLKASDLPMNASVAADLLIYALTIGPRYFPWGDYNDFVLKKNRPQDKTFSRIVGLLPEQPSASESEERDTFLKALPNHVNAQFKDAVNTSRKDINVTFSHVDISRDITFEAVTIEVEMDPTLLVAQVSGGNESRYTDIFQAGEPGAISNCGPWPALCFVKKRIYKPAYRTFDRDPLQQVIVFGSCVNAQGTEELRTASFETSIFTCENASNNSMMVLSIGKRLVADSFEQMPDSESLSRWARITNLRKIYTFTIGRLSWRLQNLSSTFNADCHDTSSPLKCMGLQLPLANAGLSADRSSNTTLAVDQRLVVSGDALPTDVLLPSTLLFTYKPRSVPLVEVSEPPYDDILTGDILLPHNAGRVVWNNTIVTKSCDADFESHIFTRLSNHMYIEHGLQPAYTAATFFLFQSAAVKDVIQNQQTNNALMLSFAGNTQDIVLRASIPDQSAWLTLAGCILLVVGLLAAIVLATRGSADEKDPLVAISAPHTIARVMLDNQQFPPLLLHRRVVEDHAELPKRKLDDFLVTDLTVQHQQKQDRLVASE